MTETVFRESHRFFHVYANVPLKLREDVCCVVEGEPLSWQVARMEIQGETEAGAKALKQLVELKII